MYQPKPAVYNSMIHKMIHIPLSVTNFNFNGNLMDKIPAKKVIPTSNSKSLSFKKEETLQFQIHFIL